MFLPPFPFPERIALITGAGSGLGAAMARALSAEGCDLVVCDLSAERLEALPATLPGPGRILISEALDVRELAALRALRDRVRDELGGVDLLINNAGVAAAGALHEHSAEDLGWVLDIDLKSVAWGCQLFIPDMLARPGRAHVVNIASAAGLLGVPYMSAYAAAKAGVIALSECLMAEHPRRALTVSAVCPGFVKTRIVEDGRLDGPPEDRRLAERLIDPPGRSPDDVARAVVQAVRKGRFLVPVFAEARLLMIVRSMPELIRHPIRRLISWRVANHRRG